MSSIALDIRDIPDLTDDLESSGETAGPDRPERAEDTAPGAATDPSSRFASGRTRLRCADCGTVLTADDPLVDHRDERHAGEASGADPHPPPAAVWHIPVHAVGPAASEPFAARLCPGSERPADPEADAVPEPEPALSTPPAPTLPPGLDWRAQPFSHGRP